ncbi:MAG: SBBP repeat-containing protein, partial [Chloroflexota bacterium]
MRTLSSYGLMVLAIVVIYALLVPGDGRLSAGDAPLGAGAPPPALSQSPLRQSPLRFIQNVGQFDDQARFQASGAANNLWLADGALWLTLLERSQPPTGGVPQEKSGLPELAPPRQGVHLKLSFAGANPRPRLEPFDRLQTHVSYFIGQDASKWRPDVPVWGGVRYVDLYPGLDLELTGTGGRLQPRLVARSEVSLSAVRLRVEGAEALSVDGHHLRISTAVGEVAFPLLVVVRPDGSPISLKAPALEGSDREVSAPFTRGDRLEPFVPLDDPTDLIYSTFLGGGDQEAGHAIAVGPDGTAYVTGYTYSSNFETTPGAFDRAYDGLGDIFVTRLITDGSALSFSTYLGGSNDDVGNAIAVGSEGTVYVTGTTYSFDFPFTPGAYDEDYDPLGDAFVTQLNATGTGLMYSTFLGGSSLDTARAIAADAAGLAYVTGYTNSNDFPTTSGALDTTYEGGQDAFVTKLSADGSALPYSTFLGGVNADSGYAIALGSDGMVYLTGSTASSDFPTTNSAFDNVYAGADDVFIARLNPGGQGMDDLD